VQVASGTSKATIQRKPVPNYPGRYYESNFNVGRSPWGEGYFSGEIDDVRAYNRALSAAEVQWLAAGNP